MDTDVRRRRNRKRLTPQSHFECSVILWDHLVKDDLTDIEEQIARLFVIGGFGIQEIAEQKVIKGKRGSLSDDMIRLYLSRIFGDHIQYEINERMAERNRKSRREQDKEHRKSVYDFKKKHPPENAVCANCGTKEGFMELDHILPFACGGTDNEDNLQYLCHKCHREKTRTEVLFYGTSGIWGKRGG